MLLFVLFSISSGEWVETTQKDFSDGAFSRNLYVSHQEDGAIEFVGRWDYNNDGYIDVSAHDWIMWGSPSGYSEEHVTWYEGNGGCDGADLNQDGYPEHITTAMCGMISIYWGTKAGPDPSNPMEFDVSGYNNEGVTTADLNNDGYLDLVISCLDDANSGILWGSATGYSLDNVTLLPVNESGFNPEVADLNKDGWLDVIVVAGNTYQGQKHYIYYGSSDGFSTSNRTTVEYGHGGPHGMSVADLNYDGWLDLVYSANIPDYAAILWGGEDVFKPDIEVEADYILPLPDRAFGGSAINHLNEDGYLDIVFFGNDGVPPRIFWGDAGGISPSRYTDLSASFGVGAGGIVADFNYDGNMDLFEYEWGGGSRFFWGPDFTPSETYNSLGCHHGFSREIGDLYTRELKETYYSSVYDTKMDLSWIETEWEGSTPGSSKIRIAVRTGAHPDDFNNPILLASASDPWIEITDDKSISDILMGCNQRYVQYRATFEYDNPACLPSLSWVKISYEGNSIEETQQPVEYEGDALPGSDLCVTRNSGYSLWSISFTPDASGPIDLAIYDIRGSRVRSLINSETVSGTFTYTWEGTDDNGKTLPSGAYFVHLTQPEMRQIAKVILMH